MLDPHAVDLDELCTALDDRTAGVTWWIDAGTGAIQACATEAGDERPTAPGWRRVRRTESYESYRDMAEFVAGVHHRRAADLLDRAITGRGAFRRFKDTLFEFPELRDQWFRFRDARAHRRALHWLATEGLVDPADADRIAARYPDPEAGEEDLPAAVSVDLGMLYGDRLRRVLLPGPWARGEAAGEVALQVIVVLDGLRSPWEELQRMDEVLWRHTERSGVAVTALPVSAAQLADPTTPALHRAVAQAVPVA